MSIDLLDRMRLGAKLPALMLTGMLAGMLRALVLPLEVMPCQPDRYPKRSVGVQNDHNEGSHSQQLVHRNQRTQNGQDRSDQSYTRRPVGRSFISPQAPTGLPKRVEVADDYGRSEEDED